MDKTTAGLLIVLAALVALAVFSASSPVFGSEATQNATVSKNTTAVAIRNQTAQVSVSYWNVTGKAGEINNSAVNSATEKQDLSKANNATCTLYNADSTYNMTVYFNISSWSDPSIVGWMRYNISAKDTNATVPAAVWTEVNSTDTTFKYGNQFPTGVNITHGEWKNLWLQFELRQKGTATSSFVVESEVVA